MANWSDLRNKKIRHQIFDELVILVHKGNHKGPESFVNYVMVNEEWRDYFEKITFQAITLDNERVRHFGAIFFQERNRIRSLKSLRLNVVLDNCSPGTGANLSYRKDVVFMHVIMDLFDVLSQWRQTDNDGIVFEIFVTCDGDKAALDSFRKKKRDAVATWGWIDQLQDGQAKQAMIDANVEEIDKDVKQLLYPITDLGHTGNNPPQRGIPIGANTQYGLLREVTVIKTLAILRHTTHSIGPDLLKLIFEFSLTHVEQILHEKWRAITSQDKEWWGVSYAGCAPYLPATLRCLSMFDEVHGELHMRKCWYTKDKLLGRSIAVATQHLRNMSLSFVVDSEDFFHIPQSTDPAQRQPLYFPSLRSLVLTNSTIRPNAQPQKLQDALSSYAVKIVYGMPALRIYEIWNAGSGFGGAFLYKFDGQRATTIVHKTSWKTCGMSSAFNTWRIVLQGLQPPRSVETFMEQVPRPTHYLDFLPELEMAANIMSGVSRINARNEAEVRKLSVPYYKKDT
jgi:uncharacterized protein DUF6546